MFLFYKPKNLRKDMIIYYLLQQLLKIIQAFNYIFVKKCMKTELMQKYIMKI